jgi:hypothetical protein
MLRRKKRIEPITGIKKLYPVILRFIEKAENEKPDTVVYLNLFNSGIVISSELIKSMIFKFLKDSLR